MVIAFTLVIIVSILIGMAISVAAFGTGGKKKNVFNDIYYSIEDIDGHCVIYTKTGEYSAILKMDNPVQKYSADIDAYYEYNNIFAQLILILGEGYAIHKQDVFVKKPFKDEDGDKREFLSESYFRYFNGRYYTDSITYLTITQEKVKTRFMSYEDSKWKDFLVKIRKVHDLLRDSGVSARFLSVNEARDFADRYFAQNFRDKCFSMNDFKVDDNMVYRGDMKTKVYSLVDVDHVAVPSFIRPFENITVNNTEMPVDLVASLDSIPNAETVVYNQMIFIPGQKVEKARLAKKKNRFNSVPSPANQLGAEDIQKVLDVLARENKLLVYCHFNIMVTVPEATDIQKCTNSLENTFSRHGIFISKKAYNQLELFVGSFPGNCYAISPKYDRFLTTSDASLCFMYKERILHSETTPLKVYYTDRQGVPVAIDIMGKEGSVKMTDNSNFFCLGPSGSGKSFHMNSVVRQLHEQNTDVVMVDTGNSYEGLCEYFNGKYIAYTDEKPITMNPFKITKEELNIEKINFLKNLVLQIWLGSNAVPSRIETSVVEQIVGEYYNVYFNGPQGYTAVKRADLSKGLMTEIANKSINDLVATLDEDAGANVEVKVERLLDRLEARRKKLQVTDLSFNTFYEYAVEAIAIICTEQCIPNEDGKGIRPSDFRTRMAQFYKGGKYEKTLNESADSDLFTQSFIVFEIDAVKDDPTLFPIVTLIIMDVFLQKMRLKKNRKCLVIEEAWKAIATPMMAEYIKYLYKTARKFWASVGVVTQEIQDIIGSPIVKEAIINNSDIFMLLDQSKFKERFDDIQTILGLTNVECKKIFTINRLDNKDGRSFFREVFIRRGITSGVYGVEEPHECYMTYTTERAEKEALKLYKRELRCTHQEAIEKYCKDWDKSGIGKSLTFAQKVNKEGRVLNL